MSSAERQSLLEKEGEAESGLMDRIVDERQLRDWPRTTLTCARCTRVFVIFAVVSSVLALCINYFHGSIEVSSSTTKNELLPIPRIVLCPLWGQEGMNVGVKAMSIGNLMTDDYGAWKTIDFEAQKCPTFESFVFVRESPQLQKLDQLHVVNTLGCICVEGDGTLGVHQVGKDYLRMALSASFTSDPAKQIAIGFSSGQEYPADWSYLPIKSRSIGDLNYETFVYGKTPVTSGTVIPSYTFGLKTAFPTPERTDIEGADTEVIFGYGSYYVSETSDVSSTFSIFALLAFLAILLAALNSLQIFDVCFPEVVDPENPSQLEPAWIFQKLCGGCCSCCRKAGKGNV